MWSSVIMIFLFSTNIIINTKTPIVRLILLLTLLDEFLWTILYVCSSIIIIKWLKNKEIKSFFAGHIKIAVTKFTRLLLNMQIAMTTVESWSNQKTWAAWSHYFKLCSTYCVSSSSSNSVLLNEEEMSNWLK